MKESITSVIRLIFTIACLYVVSGTIGDAFAQSFGTPDPSCAPPNLGTVCTSAGGSAHCTVHSGVYYCEIDGGGGTVPEMSDYLAIAFFVLAGSMGLLIRRKLI